MPDRQLAACRTSASIRIHFCLRKAPESSLCSDKSLLPNATKHTRQTCIATRTAASQAHRLSKYLGPASTSNRTYRCHKESSRALPTDVDTIGAGTGQLQRPTAQSGKNNHAMRSSASSWDPYGYRYACGFQVCTSSFPSLHHV